MSQQQIPRPDLPYPGERQSNHWLIHLWIILGGALVIVVAWAALNWPATQEPPAASIHTVVYQAEADAAHGSGRAGMYTLQSDDGGTRQGETNLPMKNRDGATGLTFTGFKSGDFVYLSIQNADAAGSVTCRIIVDGVMISENTSDGGYVIASCKGQVP